MDFKRLLGQKWIVFNCEDADLEKELNQRDPQGVGVVSAVISRGTAMRVVMKLP